MNKLGIQCQEKADAVYQYNQVVQPNSIKAINITDADFWQRIWDENPRLKYAIYREFPNGPEPWEDPEGTAAGWVNHLASKIRHLVDAGLITHFEGYNEWIHSFQAGQFQAADGFMAALIDETHETFEGKAHVIVLNASCGHFSEDIVAAFPKTLARLNECGQCLLGLHEYDREDMDRLHQEDIAGGGEGYWLVGKFLRVERALKEAGYDNVHIGLTEVGLDDAVQRPEGSHHWGWKHYGATTEEAVAHLLNERNLAWFYPLLAQSEMTVLASIFGCGMYRENNWGEWGFDIADGFPALLNGIKNLETSSPQPNGGNKMRVFDKDGVELFGFDAEALVAHYGLSVRDPSGLQDGDLYFELVALREKVSTNAAFIYRVLDEAGNPIVNPDETLDCTRAHRAFWWPSVGDNNDIETPFPTDLHPQADLGGLNVNGEGGSGMGGGAFHDPGTPGPHEAWVRHPTIPSVLLRGIGMLGNTNHDHMDGEWGLRTFQGNGPPPPNPALAIIQKAEEIISIASTMSGSTPTEMELTYPDGSKTRYTLAPTAQGLFARLWSAVKGR